MDFTFTPEQDEAAALAARILTDRATNERMRAVEQRGDRFDTDLWAELGDAGLLGLALPEEHGGAGLGLVELCRVLVEVGRTVAPVPLATTGPAARLLAESGTDAQRQRWLPGAATGRLVRDRRRGRGEVLRPRAPRHVGDAGGRCLPADGQQGGRDRGHPRRPLPRPGTNPRRHRRLPGRAG